MARKVKSSRVWLEPKGDNCDYVIWNVGDEDAYFAVGDGGRYGGKFSLSLYGISKTEKEELLKVIDKISNELTKFRKEVAK